jgi:sodium/hydrogen antiporter
MAIIAAVVAGYGLLSRRLAGTSLTAPLVFLAVGLLLGDEALGWLDLGIDTEVVRALAEATLALVLFSDAAKIDGGALRRHMGLPVRLLGIGLPLTIAAGTVVAAVMFGELLLAEAAVLAILLAPTDAALGQTVVSDRRLPEEIRQGLSVESGLNDGVCVPLLFAAIALAELESAPTFDGEVLTNLVVEIAVAIVVGVTVALVVTMLGRAADRRGWIDAHWSRIVPLATVVIAYGVTVEVGGSGFIACFAAGLAFGARVGEASEEVLELDEELGSLLSAVTFLIFAGLLLGPVLTRVDLATVVYAALSLTVVRMVPVAISLVRSGSGLATMAFAGWFGPRGLATIVFLLTVVAEAGLPGQARIVDVATITVALSVVLHGITAPVLTARYLRVT